MIYQAEDVRALVLRLRGTALYDGAGEESSLGDDAREAIEALHQERDALRALLEKLRNYFSTDSKARHLIDAALADKGTT